MSICSGTLPVTGSWAGSLDPPELDGYDQIVFVALADNVDTDGSLQLPFHSVAEGLIEAAARTPSAAAPVCVYVYSGSYSETALTIPSYVHLQGANVESTIINHASKILTLNADNTSVSDITFKSTSTNKIFAVDGTSLTGYVYVYRCNFDGAGNSNNTISVENGGLARFYDCAIEAQNVGDTIIETDTDVDNDVQFYKSKILGDVVHAGGELELTDVSANAGISCSGSSNLSITDTFLRNSVGYCLELGTTGNVFLYQSTFISPGFVTPDNYYCILGTVNPGTNEWIGNTFRHDGIAPTYTLYATGAFTFSGDRNDFEEGYNSNCTDNGLGTKSPAIGLDLVVIEDSADDYKRKRVQLNDLPGGTGGTSNLSGLTIDIDKNWLGYDIQNVGSLDVDDELTIPSDVAGVLAGDIRYNTVNQTLEYFDGAEWHATGSPMLVSSTGTAVAEGNNSLTGLEDRYMVETIEITTVSTNWTLTVYSKDDYSSDSVIVLKNRSENALLYWDYPYEDKDATSEFHYNFTDNSGTATHNIEILGTSLR